ncbi:T3SS effector HopA1 family protein [Planobispora takensis]|uniref:Uncharacterized protein n=1 Tax=Planobispora takensis TaxID=1367882 RepID=A0A8J3SX45_9ACTN|nr:T3SS effector HopA1 family protein [Planobispora takensis]GII00762.1 hypothetical protein Pta02_27700 [Planobispora takensis]
MFSSFFSKKKSKKPPMRKAARKTGTGVELTPIKAKVAFAEGTATTAPARALPKDAPLRPKTRPTAPATSGEPAGPVGVVKTKRPIVTAEMTDDQRYDYNKEATEAVLGTIYEAFYNSRTGDRLDLDGRIGKIYGMMGKGASEYMKHPVTHDQFRAFNVTDKAVRTKGQKVSAYQKALKAYDDWPGTDPAKRPPIRPEKPVGPASNDESVRDGDYFHVHNLRPDLTRDLKGKSRRIIVNVKTQQTGLKVAEAVQNLFTDPDVGPGIREYKIYLSEKAQDVAQAKHDKLVIYYAMKDEPGGEDTRGDKIVSAISKAIPDTDVGEGFAPFYSIIGPGIAWAEEPKHFVESLKNSFTRTRSDIITDVIQKNDKVLDKADFVKRVDDALKAAGVDPERPHRHLTGAIA